MSERIQAAVGRIRAELDTIVADLRQNSDLAERLLQTVRGDRPAPPGSHRYEEHSPGAVAAQLAILDLDPDASAFGIEYLTPESTKRAQQLLEQAGYWYGSDRDDPAAFEAVAAATVR